MFRAGSMVTKQFVLLPDKLIPLVGRMLASEDVIVKADAEQRVEDTGEPDIENENEPFLFSLVDWLTRPSNDTNFDSKEKYGLHPLTEIKRNIITKSLILDFIGSKWRKVEEKALNPQKFLINLINQF